jgi:hypothetical protein
MKYFILLILTFALVTCSKSDNDIGNNCEIVVNADGPGYLKVINTMNTRIEVFLPEYAFAARMNANKCEIFGMATGTRKAEISLCADSDCNNLSKTRNVQFLIKDGETHTIQVDENYFK